MYMLLLLCAFVSIYVKFIFQLFKFLFTCFRRLNLRVLHPSQLTFSRTHIATARQVIVRMHKKLLQDRLFYTMIKKIGMWETWIVFFYSRLKWRPSLLNYPKKGKLQRLKAQVVDQVLLTSKFLQNLASSLQQWEKCQSC
jgi:hypothetical protein